MKRELLFFVLLFVSGLHWAYGQDRTITGRITDDTGVPLIGATVLVKNSTTGSVADFDGYYSLNIPQEDSTVLVYSFTGYIPQEIVVANQSVIDVSLSTDVFQLEGVVVVGYGTQKRRDLTGSVSSVSAEMVEEVPVLSLDRALQGRASGVNVLQQSNTPGGEVRVRIRGINSINGNNDPLYVIDGVIGANINTVDPNDIESIDVLKDAAAASIYGARGANGVVIVTTKSGRQGKPRVTFDTWYGIDRPAELYDMMNARQYMEYVNEADVLNNTGNTTYPNVGQVVGQIGDGVAWQDQIFSDGTNQKYYLSVNGGNETVTYMGSGGYQKQTGLIPGSDFERYTARLNVEIQASDKVRFGSNLSYVHTTRQTFQEDATTGFPNWSGPVSWTVSNPPLVDPRDGKGNLIPLMNNPFASVPTDLYINGLFNAENEIRESVVDYMQMNFFGEYQIIEPLVFRVTLGVQPTYSEGNFFNPFEVPNQFRDQFRSASRSTNRSNRWLIEPTLTFNETFGGQHSLTVLGGFSGQKTRSEALNAGSENFPFDFVQWYQLEAGDPESFNIGSGLFEEQYVGVFGRINYAFNDRYLIQVNGRYDGSSKFAKKNRWAFFPSVSAGWRISEEPFLRSSDFVDNFKLRASYGSIGSQATPAYATIAQMGGSGWDRRYGFGNQSIFTYVAQLANPDLKWETTTQANVGIDIGFMEGKLNFTLDYYDKETTDLILNQNITIVNNAERDHDPDVITNVGSMRNSGFEFNGNYIAPIGQNFTWTTNLNFSVQNNEVTDLNLSEGQEFLDLGNNLIRNYHRLQQGESFGNYVGYRTNGIFQTQQDIDGSAQPMAKPGDIRYVDVNGDGTINEQDKTIVGNALPDVFGGWTNTFEYKGIELSVLLYGAFGHQLFNMGAARFKYGLSNIDWNKWEEVATDRWTGPGTSNDIPRAGYNPINGTDGPNGTLDVTTEDASFLKLRNLTLAYNFPQQTLSNLGINSLRVYFKGQNLLVFTDYSGYDPEQSNFRSGETLIPVETALYPLVRTYMFGLNVSF